MCGAVRSGCGATGDMTRSGEGGTPPAKGCGHEATSTVREETAIGGESNCLTDSLPVVSSVVGANRQGDTGDFPVRVFEWETVQSLIRKH